MVQRTGGMRRKSRHRFSKHVKRKGKISVTRFLQQLSAGDHVALVGEPAYHGGLYKARFHGKTGEVAGSQGNCYRVKIYDGNKQKILIVHPVHLRRL